MWNVLFNFTTNVFYCIIFVFSKTIQWFSIEKLVAILTVYIAYQQWHTSEKQRKQDLFEKRYENLYIPMLDCLKKIENINKKKIAETKKREYVQKEIDFFWERYGKYSFLISEEDDKKLTNCYNFILELSQKEPPTPEESTMLFPLFMACLKTMQQILGKYLRIEPNTFFFKIKSYFTKKYSVKDVYEMISEKTTENKK